MRSRLFARPRPAAILPLFAKPDARPAHARDSEDLRAWLRRLTPNGSATVEREEAGLRFFSNAFWPGADHKPHSLHIPDTDPVLPPAMARFLITHLTAPGEPVYAPSSGTGTAALAAALAGRWPIANDHDPLSELLLRPRLLPPPLAAIKQRIDSLPLNKPPACEGRSGPLATLPQRTQRQWHALRDHLFEREIANTLDAIDDWLRMVALTLLTTQTADSLPEKSDLPAQLHRRSRHLLADGPPPDHPTPYLTTAPHTAQLQGTKITLLLTPATEPLPAPHPQHWFAGIDPTRLSTPAPTLQTHLPTYAQILRPGGFLAVALPDTPNLAQHLITAMTPLPFDPISVINTPTAGRVLLTRRRG